MSLLCVELTPSSLMHLPMGTWFAHPPGCCDYHLLEAWRDSLVYMLAVGLPAQNIQVLLTILLQPLVSL